MKRAPDAQVNSGESFRVTGGADGVWMELPTGLVWLPPDFAEALAMDLSHSAKECYAARRAQRGAPKEAA